MTAAATRRLRRESPFDPSVFSLPLFWALAPAARGLSATHRMPSVEEIDAACGAAAGVRFVPAKPRPRRGDGALSYDASITERGEVPTREGSWHDLMNALVWAAFPRGKRALHALQARYVAAARGTGRRTPPHDALAILDEGGVLVCASGPLDGEAAIARGLDEGTARIVPFGHAIYESVAIGAPRPLVRARALVVAPGQDDPALVSAADAALADVLTRAELARTPKDLPCITLARVFGETPEEVAVSAT